MSVTPSQLRQAALNIVQVLRDAGHVAYFAGGCVRDRLLGMEPKDYDVATDARPEQVQKLFRSTQNVGEAFGVILVRFARGHPGIEVATFRSESGYEDGRRPTQVAFCDARTDAMRRDFTINGLFEDPLAKPDSERVIDYVGGRKDLKNKVIRAIGDPSQRFGEDYLRMLRAVRFAARLNFRMHRLTARAIRGNARYLGQISRERIGTELLMMLQGARPMRALLMLQKLGLDGPTLNEDHRDLALPTVRQWSRLRREHFDQPHLPAVGLAAWLMDRHRSAVVHAELEFNHFLQSFVEGPFTGILQRWRRAICLSNEMRDSIDYQMQLLVQVMHWPALGVARRKRLLAHRHWSAAWMLLRCCRHEKPVEELIRQLQEQWPRLADEGIAPKPLLDGDDLIRVGRKPGPGFRRLLDNAYDAQLEGLLTTREQALHWLRQQD